MGYKDILLHLDSYPDPVPLDSVDQAVALCACLGGAVTATAFQVRIPVNSNIIAERLLGLSKLAAEEEGRSRDNVESLMARFSQAAGQARLEHHSLSVEAIYYDRPARLAELARTRDLCVIPYFGDVAPQTSQAEAVAFGSGRPLLIFRGGRGQLLPRAFNRILLAWDGGRAASRAVADAMPLLRTAEEVRILSVLGEKPATVGGQADELRRHLACHGVMSEAEEYTSAGRPIGDILEQVAVERGFDLLVMGAYGHSRVREFILGGATQSIMTVPPIPVLLSH